MLALPFPEIDPIAFSIGPLDVRWYGLAYMAGLLFGWLYIRRLLSTPHLWSHGRAPFTADKADDLLLFMTIGVVAGGRLGFALLYEPGYFLNNPLDIILGIREGGMAFHGALLGCGVAVWAFAARNNVSVWSAMDVCAAAVPIGLFFGRMANFINGELYGRVTTMPWGMVFPGTQEKNASEPVLRHPSQLYEGFFEGIVLFFVLRYLTHHQGALHSPGMTTGVFLIGYGLARSFCELFREYDVHHVFSQYGFTPGIVYSIPMIVLGILFVRSAQTRQDKFV